MRTTAGRCHRPLQLSLTSHLREGTFSNLAVDLVDVCAKEAVEEKLRLMSGDERC